MPVSEDYMRSKEESRRRKASTHSADQAKRESAVLDFASLGGLVDGPKELGIVFSSERASLYETAFDDTYHPPSPQSANFTLPNRQSRSSIADHAVRSKASNSPASSEKFDKLENELRFLREQIASLLAVQGPGQGAAPTGEIPPVPPAPPQTPQALRATPRGCPSHRAVPSTPASAQGRLSMSDVLKDLDKVKLRKTKNVYVIVSYHRVCRLTSL